MRISDWSSDVCSSDLLEQLAEQIAVAEAAMPVLREGRVIGHSAVEPQPAEPTIREVQMHLLAQPPLRTDPHEIADDQHPDHQLRIDRRPTRVAIIRPKVFSDIAQLHEPVD